MLAPQAWEIGVGAVLVGIVLAVAVASYRRSRCLSGHPVWKSLAIAAVSGLLWELWLVVWWVNRDLVARRWRERRARDVEASAPVSSLSDRRS